MLIFTFSTKTPHPPSPSPSPVVINTARVTKPIFFPNKYKCRQCGK